MERKKVYDVIDNERDYQDHRWGNQHDRAHEVESFMLYMDHYLSEAKRAISTTAGTQQGLDMLRKVVALGIACFEIHGVPERIN